MFHRTLVLRLNSGFGVNKNNWIGGIWEENFNYGIVRSDD